MDVNDDLPVQVNGEDQPPPYHEALSQLNLEQNVVRDEIHGVDFNEVESK